MHEEMPWPISLLIGCMCALTILIVFWFSRPTPTKATYTREVNGKTQCSYGVLAGSGELIWQNCTYGEMP